MSETSNAPLVAVIGTDPAELMVVEVLSRNGVRVEMFDVTFSAGREFLLAGIGGMSITHLESLDAFLGRYCTWREALAPLIGHFNPDALHAWIHGLGIDTFVGSSDRVFPTEMGAVSLLRVWPRRLRELGVQLHMRYRWVGWTEPSDHTQVLRFEAVGVKRLVQADTMVLAIGGGSWPRLGPDGAQMPLLEARGVQV